MKLLILLLALFSSTVSLALQGGTEVGNGSDEVDNTAGAAWFLGQQKPIRACVDVSPDFGLSAKEARREVVKAFAAWPAYVNEKNLYRPASFQYPWSGWIELHPENIPAMNMSLSDKGCVGGEDLTIRLGVENETVRKDKAKFRNPVAFAQRTAYDVQKGWGRGYVWVRSAAPNRHAKAFPNWSKAGQLNLILKHEFGHVFGIGHQDETIMAADIEKNLLQYYEMGANDLTGTSTATQELAAAVKGLDFQRSLEVCRECSESFNSIEGGAPLLSGAREIINLRDGYVHPINCFINNFVPARFAFEIRCEMNGQTYRWKVKLIEEMKGLGYGDLFKVCDREEGNCHGGFITSSFSWMGLLTDEKGQSFLVKVNRNYGTGPYNSIHVDLLKGDGDSKPVFWITAGPDGRMK